MSLVYFTGFENGLEKFTSAADNVNDFNVYVCENCGVFNTNSIVLSSSKNQNIQLKESCLIIGPVSIPSST